MSSLPFTFSALPDRPPLVLPDGARVAVYILVAAEHFEAGRPAISLDRTTAGLAVDPLNYGWRDYGARVGIWRLVELFDRLSVPVSVAINSEVCAEYPEIVQAGRERGWAWVAHGRNNSTMWTGMTEAEERDALREVVATISAATGTPTTGWMGPAFTETTNTPRLGAELGLTYTVDWANDDQPYRLSTEIPVVSLPHPSEMHDVQQLLIQRNGADDYARGMIEHFDVLYEEGAESPSVFGIGVHPFLLGQPYRIAALERVLRHICAHDLVWLTTTDALASWSLSSAQGTQSS